MPPKKKTEEKRSRTPASSPSKQQRGEDDSDVQTASRASESKSPSKKAASSSTSKAVAAATASSPKALASVPFADGPKTQQEQEKGCTDFGALQKSTKFDPSKHVKLISWNVAGLRAVLTKNPKELQNLVDEEKPDVLCLQETKLSDWAGLASLGALDGYTHADTISTAKKGYSGCRTYVKNSLDTVHTFGFDRQNPKNHDDEGRVVTTNVYNFTLVNTYVPNSGMTLDRLGYRVEEFDPQMRAYLKSLGADKAATGKVIWTGDLNVAERDFDRYYKAPWKQMQKCSGFTPEERVSFRKTLSDLNMVDAFRHVYPNACGPKMMTFFSNRVGGPSSGLGWRLDYFIVSAALASKVVDCYPIHKWSLSDHKPICLLLSH
jgi:AP endonuclease-1